MKPFSNLALLLAWGCDTWPTHETASFEHEGIESSLSESEILSEIMDWGIPLSEEESNDYPRIGAQMDGGEGWHIEGLLDGVGWDASAEPDFSSLSDCSEDLAFPPLTSGGNYMADVEWMGILPRVEGTLCMSIELSPDFEPNSLRYDILLYRLNACGDPVEFYLDEEDEKLGFGAGGDRTSWSSPVDEGDILGVVLAGYSPDIDEEVPWKIALSLLDIPTQGVCPTPPWR